MDITQLKAFVTVAREGNLTRAAERLFVTQPAVSLQIKSLQNSLNVQLFTRTASGMTLTNNGVKLLHHAEQVLASVEELRQAAASLYQNLSGELAIGTILDPQFIRLGDFLKRLVETYPQLSTRLQQGMSGSVLQQIRNGMLDVGFYLGQPPEDLKVPVYTLTLTYFKYNVVAPSGWENRVKGKDWPALAQLPWVWTPPESAHNRLLSKVFAEHHIMPNKVALVDQEPSMLDLVKSGVGLTLARDTTALREALTHGLVIADAVSVSTELSFITLEKRKNEAMIAAAFAMLKQGWNLAG
jgi:DNA-binding transcriptional LysR family regulator